MAFQQYWFDGYWFTTESDHVTTETWWPDTALQSWWPAERTETIAAAAAGSREAVSGHRRREPWS